MRLLLLHSRSQFDTHHACDSLRSSGGIFKSTNGGASWSNSSTGLPEHHDSDYHHRSGESGQRSTPARSQASSKALTRWHWTSASSGLGNASIISLAINAVTPAIVYAEVQVERFQTIDGGSTGINLRDDSQHWREHTGDRSGHLSTVYAGTGTTGSTMIPRPSSEADPTGSALVYSTFLAAVAPIFWLRRGYRFARNAIRHRTNVLIRFSNRKSFQPL